MRGIPSRVGWWVGCVVVGACAAPPSSSGIAFGPPEPWPDVAIPLQFQPSGEGFVFAAGARVTRVDGAGVELRWNDGLEHTVELGLPTVDGVALGTGFATALGEGALQREVGDVTETLKPHAQGIEADWRFAMRPAGDGDVVVRWPVGASVREVERGEDGVRVTVADGEPRRASDGVWIDAEGRRVAVKVVVERDAFVWRVTSEVLEETVFPALLDPVVGPGVDLAPIETGLPAPISNPRVASAGGKALIVWVDQPYVVTREAAESPAGAFVNAYRRGEVRLKAKLVATLEDVRTAPVIDLGVGPGEPEGYHADRYDNTFRVVPNGDGFAVFWKVDSSATSGIMVTRVSPTRSVSPSVPLDIAALPVSSGTLGGWTAVNRRFEAVIHEGAVALVSGTNAGLALIRLNADLVPVAATLLDPTASPEFDVTWGASSVGGRGAVLGETTVESTSTRKLFVLLLPTATQPYQVVTLARPVSSNPVARDCWLGTFSSAFCGWMPGGPFTARPASLTAIGGVLIVDDGGALLRVDPANPAAAPASATGEEPGERGFSRRPPGSSTLCGSGSTAIRIYQTDYAYSVLGPRALATRGLDASLESPAARPMLAKQSRIGPAPCGETSDGPFVVDRALLVHGFGSGFAAASTTQSPISVQSAFRTLSAQQGSGGRHGFLITERRMALDGTAPARFAVTRFDLLGRRLDAQPLVLGPAMGVPAVPAVTSTERHWFGCLSTPGAGDSTAIDVFRLSTRGSPDLVRIPVGSMALRSLESCLLQVVGERLHVFWRGSVAGAHALWHRALDLEGVPLGPAVSLGTSEAAVPVSDLSIPTPNGVLLSLGGSTIPSNPTGTYYFDGASIRSTSLPFTPWSVAERPGGWATLNLGTTPRRIVLGGGPEGETLQSPTTALPAALSSYNFVWDGVGPVFSTSESLTGAQVSAASATFGPDEPIPARAIPRDPAESPTEPWTSTQLATTWGGVSRVFLTFRTPTYDVSETETFAFHRNAAVTADHLERTVTQNAAHPITLAPTTNAAGDPQSFEVHVPPLHGTVTLAANVATYRSDTEYAGEDSFFFTATGPDGSKRAFTVLLNVTAVNDPPTGTDATIALDEDETAEFNVETHDPEDAALTLRNSVAPAHGTLTRTGDTWTYTPETNFHGDDLARFVASDGTNDSTPITIRFTVAPVNDPPELESGSVSGDEDTTLSFTLAGTDIDGDALSYALVTPPTTGEATLTGNLLRFVLPSNSSGSATVVVRAIDPSGATSDPATITFDVRPVNDPPTGSDATIALDEDETAEFTVETRDPEGSALTLRNSVAPAHGTLTRTGDTWTYTPETNFHGDDLARFVASDGTNDSTPITIRFTVAPVNDPPELESGSVSGDEDTTLSFTLAGTDIDGDALSYALVTPPTTGEATLTGNLLRFVPPANSSGSVTVVVRAIDPSNATSNDATITFQVLPVNDAPVVADDAFALDEDTHFEAAPNATDVDDAVSQLSVELIGSPSKGTASVVSGRLRYVANLNANGTDTLRYRVRDPSGALSGEAIRTVTIRPVNDAPDAQPGTAFVIAGGPKTLEIVASDVDGDPLTFVLMTPPSDGTATPTATGFTYSCDAFAETPDSFTFRVRDPGGLESPIRTFTLSRRSAQRVPVVQPLDVATLEDVAVTFTLSGTDADGDALTFAVVDPPSSGLVRIEGNQAVFEPAPNFHGPVTFTYAASDGIGSSAPATVSIDVTNQNDVPVASPQSLSLDEDTTRALTLEGSDIDAERLTFTIGTPPAQGALTGTPPTLTYTPPPDFQGEVTFTFVAHDAASSSPPATVTFTVRPVADTPIALARTSTGREDVIQVIELGGTDADGDALTFALSGEVAHGTVTIDGTRATFTPDPDWHGETSFQYVASDGVLHSAPVEVSILVTPVNDAPIATPSQHAVDEDGTRTVTLAGTDTESDPLTFRLVTPPLHGTLSGEPPTVTYVPEPEYSGLDRFTFVANDGALDSAPANVGIVVRTINDPPVAPDLDVTQPQGPVALSFTATDVDGPVANWNLVLGPPLGTLSGVLPDVTWTPPAGFVGETTLVVAVSDGTSSDEATARITIVNAPPSLSIEADTLAVDEGTSVRFFASALDPGGDTLSASWSFGDGNTATGFEVTHTWVGDGTFEVSCTVDDGRVSVTRTLEVVVRNAAPVLVGIDSPAAVNEGASVTFVASASDPGTSDVLSVTWSFGDGGTGQGLEATHLFADDGTFDVVATVVDSAGAASTLSRTVVVANLPPVPTPVDDLTADVGDALDVTLAATDVPADPLSWRLLSGPGRIEQAHWRFDPLLADVGRHVVTIEVSDGDGGVSTIVFDVEVLAAETPVDGGPDVPEVPVGCGCDASGALAGLALLPLLARRRRDQNRILVHGLFSG